jgi:hypothetical protein
MEFYGGSTKPQYPASWDRPQQLCGQACATTVSTRNMQEQERESGGMCSRGLRCIARAVVPCWFSQVVGVGGTHVEETRMHVRWHKQRIAWASWDRNVFGFVQKQLRALFGYIGIERDSRGIGCIKSLPSLWGIKSLFEIFRANC